VTALKIWPFGSKTLRCSFCAKTENQAGRLIAGPDVYICDDCVDLCCDILAERGWLKKEPAHRKSISLRLMGSRALENFKAIFTTDPLGEVVFSPEVVVLVFQNGSIRLYNPVTLHLLGQTASRDEVGFCDHLVSLIQKRVVEVRSEPEESLDLHFENGWVVSLSLEPVTVSDLKAFYAHGADGKLYVP
jgi:hypothetical protein